MGKIDNALDCMHTSLFEEIQAMNARLDNLLNPEFFTRIITDAMEKLLDARDQDNKLFLNTVLGE